MRVAPLRHPVASLLCLASLAWLLAGCATPPEPPPLRLEGPLPLQAPTTIEAGEAVEITVGPVDAPDGTPIVLTQLGTDGARPRIAPVEAGVARFRLSPAETEVAGAVTLVASAGGARGTAAMRILPGPPVEPLTPLVGARSIVADAAHWALAVVIPFDRFGNVVADGTPVTFRASHPGAWLEETVRPVAHGLAWLRVWSGTVKGRTTISVQSGEVFGPDAILLEVAGWPEPFAISADPETLPADGRELMTLRTDPLRDRYGNLLPDGTLVTFQAEQSDGTRRLLPAYTVDGRAEVPLEAPAVPGTVTIRATVFAVESETLRVTFTDGPAVAPIPLEVLISESTIEVTAGPLLGPLEQYVPDGTLVYFRIQNTQHEARWERVEAESGYATVELRRAFLDPGAYNVEVMVGSGTGQGVLMVPEP